MSDHIADIKKYTKNPINEKAYAGLLKTYRLVISKADTQYVACADPKERETVRKNFLEGKLSLKGADESSIVEVCQTMKADRTKSRLTFYYLLAEKHGKLGLFE